MNELEQLKAQKAELETELNKVKDKIYQIETDEFCAKWGVKVGDIVEFESSWSSVKQGKIEAIRYGLAFEIRLFKKNGELGNRIERMWPSTCQFKKLN